MTKTVILTLAFLASASADALQAASPRNVILITWDGVRYEEIFRGPDPLLAGEDRAPIVPYMQARVAAGEAVLFGDSRVGSVGVTGNTKQISLPGYMTLMSGFAQDCDGNGCPRIGVETMPERLVRDLGVTPAQVATFTSWDTVGLAVESVVGRTFVAAGNAPVVDQPADAELAALNARQLTERAPWGEARLDELTIAQSMRYLRVHQPRFLYVSLNDTDEHGHRDEYPDALAKLRRFDAWLQELDHTLAAMGEYGANTCVLVTTDHGRGKGENWKHHSALVPNSQFIWIYGRCPGASHQLDAGGLPHVVSHPDIRPTVEMILGLEPFQCARCGVPLWSLLPGDRRRDF